MLKLSRKTHKLIKLDNGLELPQLGLGTMGLVTISH